MSNLAENLHPAEEHVYEALGTLPLKTFCRLFDYPITKVRSKIRRGVWKEGEVWYRDPDKETHIIIEGYKEWLKPAYLKALEFAANDCKSDSQTRQRAKERLGLSITPPPQLT